MGVTRRKFLSTSCSAIAGALTCGALRPSFAFAQDPAGARLNIVEIFLAGGADCRYLYPYIDGAVGDALASVRPNLTVPTANIITPDSYTQGGRSNPIGFHPEFSGIIEMANDTGARMALITEYGATENASRSHEVATRMFRDASLRNPAQLKAGWIGRLAQTFSLPGMTVWGFGIDGSKYLKVDGPDKPFVVSNLSGVSFANKNTGNFSCNGIGGAPCGTGTMSSGEDSVLMRDVYNRLQDASGRGQTGDGELLELMAGANKSMFDAVPVATRMRTEVNVSINDFRSGVGANNLADSCADIARAIHYLNLSPNAPAHIKNGTKVFTTSRGGWDSHASQTNNVPGNIRIVSSAIRGLVQYLHTWSLLNNTVIIVKSEFGRTNRENGSRGTDHAEAGHCLVIGGPSLVRGGVFGPEASLTEAQNSNYFSAQVPLTGIIRKILERSFDTSGLNQVFIDPMPGSVPNFLA